MERAVCYCYGGSHLGSTMAKAEDLNSLRQPSSGYNMRIKLYSHKGNHGFNPFIVLLCCYIDTTSMYICVVHIAGVNNKIADSSSPFQQDKFRWLVPLANPAPDNIPVWLM